MGDIGNPLTSEQLTALRDRVDVLLALTGGHATIALDDLDTAIRAIQPRVVIPMHYYHSRGVLNILPVDAFTARYPVKQVIRTETPHYSLSVADLPASSQIVVLEQAR